MKKRIFTAIIAIACSTAMDAQVLRTTVAQGEIEGVESNGFCAIAIDIWRFVR